MQRFPEKQRDVQERAVGRSPKAVGAIRKHKWRVFENKNTEWLEAQTHNMNRPVNRVSFPECYLEIQLKRKKKLVWQQNIETGRQ